MNTQDDSTLGTGTLDAAIRAHHESALERLSPRARAQLAQRRNAALRGQAARAGGHRIRYAAAGFAALCAIAIGVRFLPPAVHGIPAPVAAGAATAVEAQASTTLLDEDPEFYAWLASSDAQLVAME